jgi:hypothetical protein
VRFAFKLRLNIAFLIISDLPEAFLLAEVKRGRRVTKLNRGPDEKDDEDIDRHSRPTMMSYRMMNGPTNTKPRQMHQVLNPLIV